MTLGSALAETFAAFSTCKDALVMCIDDDNIIEAMEGDVMLLWWKRRKIASSAM